MKALVDLDAVEKRIASVTAVRQVVHAIWATARAQLPFVEEAAAEAGHYLDWVDGVVERLAGSISPRGGRGALVVAVGPERPYCGALHRQILAKLPPDGEVALVGNRLAELAETDGPLRARTRFTTQGPMTPDDYAGVARAVAASVLAHARSRRVDLLYPSGEEITRVVLLSGERMANPSPPETLSAATTVLERAAFEAVTGRIVVALSEALRAEVRARVTAADRARQACDRKLESLRGAWRVLRQDEITREILENVAATSGRRSSELSQA